ncbi:BQ5605_C010g06053 [Microbotryum silenes-dioicae]|uniref:BQ5605_C010g06053 protein n=1 Tax=Microbotryum silenes-dioicae TaxID=796604 RepID=A0A2X0LQH4_9BASI|nr:BQ5605_C010g06053 [Microbotryum silenes-dioicae]
MSHPSPSTTTIGDTLNDKMSSLFHLQPSSHKRKKAYKIGAHLGTGGFGEVKQATELATGRQVAIKIILKSKIPDVKIQVKRQDDLKKLDHPHIVKLFEWFESKEKMYLVFELAAGGELFDHLIDAGRFDEDEAKEVAYALCDAVAYLASHNVLHRDIKPENVLYRDPPGHNGAGHDDCVLSDFGLATVVNPNERLHTIAGSAGYSAPEMYSEEGYGLAADCWSLGVVVFAMMGGRFPYKATEPRALAHEARTTELYFPPVWRPISAQAKDFVRQLLEVDPTKRMTALQALQHPWLRTAKSRPPSPMSGTKTPLQLPLDPTIHEEDEEGADGQVPRRNKSEIELKRHGPPMIDAADVEKRLLQDQAKKIEKTDSEEGSDGFADHEEDEGDVVSVEPIKVERPKVQKKVSEMGMDPTTGAEGQIERRPTLVQASRKRTVL